MILNAVEYLKAKYRFPCECPECLCPSAGGRKFTFRHVRGNIVYYNVPKVASCTIRETVYGDLMRDSLKPLPLRRKKLFRFSFVRNPWDRMVSNWTMFTTQEFRRNQLRSMGGNPDADFKEFVKYASRNFNHHWLPQSWYLPDNLNYLGKIETFDRDFTTLLTLLDLPTEFGRLNAGERENFRNYYDGETIEWVENLYLQDILRFGYSFEK